MKIKIISDGYSKNTKVINEETGHPLEGVTYINWNIGINGMSECTIKLHNVPLEVKAGNLKRYELSNKR